MFSIVEAETFRKSFNGTNHRSMAARNNLTNTDSPECLMNVSSIVEAETSTRWPRK